MALDGQIPAALKLKPKAKLSITDCTYLCLADGQWRTFWEIQTIIKQQTGKFYSENSISAAIRNLRNTGERYTYELHSWKEVVIKRRRNNSKAYEYKLVKEGVDNE